MLEVDIPPDSVAAAIAHTVIVAETGNPTAVAIKHAMQVPTLVPGDVAVEGGKPKFAANSSEPKPKRSRLPPCQRTIAPGTTNTLPLADNSPFNAGRIHRTVPSKLYVTSMRIRGSCGRHK